MPFFLESTIFYSYFFLFRVLISSHMLPVRKVLRNFKPNSNSAIRKNLHDVPLAASLLLVL
jgi:hypothetical protein